MSPTPERITAADTHDIRFPASRELDGSDAMNPDPDCSGARVVLRTDASDGLDGHGFALTIGRGKDVQVAPIHALRHHVVRSHCTAPAVPGFSAAVRPESAARCTCPGGTFRAAESDPRQPQKGQTA